MYWVEYNLHPRLTWRSAAFPIKKQLLQLSAKFIWVNSSTSNCKRFEHSHQDRLDREVLTPSRPANAPSWFVKFVRQLLVGPQDAWRPNQTFHLLQFWPRRNEACCWPLVSSGKLPALPALHALLHSRIQNPRIRSHLVLTFWLSKHLVQSWQLTKHIERIVRSPQLQNR